MRLDNALALVAIGGGVGIALAAARGGYGLVLTLLVLGLLALRSLVGPLMDSRTRERLDVLAAFGVLGFIVLVLERARRLLSL